MTAESEEKPSIENPTRNEAGPRVQYLQDHEGRPVQLVYAIPPELLQGANAEQDSLSLSHLSQKIIRKKWWILVGSVIGGVIGLIVALGKPNVYTATVVALPPSDVGSGSSLAQYAGLAAMAGMQLPTGPASSVDEIMAILDSRRLAEPLIDEYGLRDYYMGSDRLSSYDALLNAFARDFSATHNKSSNRITFSYTHREPEIAAAVANSAAERLSSEFNEIHQSAAKREVTFLTGRLRRADDDVSSATSELAKFQRETGAIEIEAQTRATIEAVAELQGELIAQQIELRALLASQAGKDNPSSQLLQERITAANEEMERLLGSERVEGGVLLALGTAPQLSIQYLNLLREVKKHEAVRSAVSMQLESAEVNVARNSEVVTVVDSASVPDKSSGPDRMKILIMGICLGGLAGIAGSVLLRFCRRNLGIAKSPLPGMASAD